MEIQRRRFRNVSLKWKLSFALVCLTMGVVGLYIYLAKDTFESDKIAYVLESRQIQLQALASGAIDKFNRASNAARMLLLGYDEKSDSLTHAAKAYFQSQTTVLAIKVTGKDGEEVFEIAKTPEFKARLSEFVKKNDLGDQTVSVVDAQTFLFRSDSIGMSGAGLVMWAMVTIPDLLPRQIKSSGNVLLVTGDSVLASTGDVGPFRAILPELTRDRADLTTTKQIESDRYLFSVTPLKDYPLKYISIDTEEEALSAIGLLYKRSLRFVVFSLFLTVLLALFIALGLTKRLTELSDVALEIGKGNFSHRLNIRSNDEIGTLAKAFRRMSAEIQQLLERTKENARMEEELKTARLVQDHLFPKRSSVSKGEFSLAGFYQTSTECGGDWWYYFERGDELFVVIADATGHGTPAALITAVARSLFSKIENSDMTLGEMMADWDRAVKGSSGGLIFMTAFLCRIHTKTGQMNYVNASHEAPFYVQRRKGESVCEVFPFRADEKIGARIGDQKSRLEERSFQLPPGSRLIVFTDGIWAVENRDGKTLSETRFMRTIAKFSDEAPETVSFVDKIGGHLKGHAQGLVFPDDVSFIVIDRKA